MVLPQLRVPGPLRNCCRTCRPQLPPGRRPGMPPPAPGRAAAELLRRLVPLASLAQRPALAASLPLYQAQVRVGWGPGRVMHHSWRRKLRQARPQRRMLDRQAGRRRAALPRRPQLRVLLLVLPRQRLVAVQRLSLAPLPPQLARVLPVESRRNRKRPPRARCPRHRQGRSCCHCSGWAQPPG